MKILRVTQEHIDKANEIRKNDSYYRPSRSCPLALAGAEMDSQMTSYGVVLESAIDKVESRKMDRFAMAFDRHELVSPAEFQIVG